METIYILSDLFVDNNFFSIVYFSKKFDVEVLIAKKILFLIINIDMINYIIFEKYNFSLCKIILLENIF